MNDSLICILRNWIYNTIYCILSNRCCISYCKCSIGVCIWNSKRTHTKT